MYDHRAVAAYFYSRQYMNKEFESPIPDVRAERDRALTFIEAMGYLSVVLNADMTEDEIMTRFYDAGKLFYGKPRLRDFFRDFYLMMTGREQGYRIGTYVYIMGVDQFRIAIHRRLSNPLGHIIIGE